jgi:hypothetical protein
MNFKNLINLSNNQREEDGASSEQEVVTEPSEPPIEVIYTGTCPSISGRSNLTFDIGRNTEDASLHLRIASNDGGGMFYEGWASATQIDEIVKGKQELTAKSFRVLHPGRSINTAGFVLASLKHLGLVRVNEENTRLHEHVPTTTFEQVAMAVMGQPDLNTPKGRKTLKLKKEEA